MNKLTNPHIPTSPILKKTQSKFNTFRSSQIKSPKTLKEVKTRNIIKTRNNMTEPITIIDPYDTYQEGPKQKSKGVEYPKNINEFIHLTVGGLLTHGNLKWTLNLRAYKGDDKTKKKKPTKNLIIHPPTFYDEDLSKYTKRKKGGTRPQSSNPNFKNVEHLTLGKDKGNVNNSQFTFATNLRNFKPMPDTFINKDLWTYTPAKTDTFSKFPALSLESEKSNLNKIEKFIVRPLSAKYDSITIGNNTIKRRKMIKDINVMTGLPGEHLSRPLYSSNYQDANTFANNELLRKCTNSQCLFSLNLRRDKPVERTRTKRLAKAEMDKRKEALIKEKHDEWPKCIEKKK